MSKTKRQLDLEIEQMLAGPSGPVRAPRAPKAKAPPPATLPPRTKNKRRHEVAYPNELAQLGEHFASGVNHAGEVKGLGMSGRSFGIAAQSASEALLAELAKFSFNGGPKLFVDSGAFSEVEFHKNGPPTVKKLITDKVWRKRLALYEKLAEMYGPRCYLVAPDQVGNQKVTLERLAKYAPEISACAALRANIIVPVQKGPTPMSVFYQRACDALGLRDTPIAGIPMKKDATSLAQLIELVDSLPWFGARLHLLGLGPQSDRWDEVISAITSRRPNAVITSDSVTVRRLAGRTNGPGGGPRILTRYQDEAKGTSWGKNATDVKAYALSKQGGDEARKERAAALKAGWFDTEIYDTLDEAQAHHDAGYPDEG